jgi:hypothetical protein
MKYIDGLAVGLTLGIVGATVYYVLRALDELDDMDVTPEFAEWANIINFPTKNK